MSKQTKSSQSINSFPTYNNPDMPKYLLPFLAEAYLYLLELAERHPDNISLCHGILMAISEMDIALGETSQATSPYVDLNEYFLYLYDAQKPNLSEESRATILRGFKHFRETVTDFIEEFKPDPEEMLNPEEYIREHKLLDKINADPGTEST